MGGSIPTPTWPPTQQCPGTSMATAATWHTGQGVVMPPGPEHATWPRHCEPGQGRQEVSLSCCGHSICQASSWACLITWSLKATHWAHEGFQPSLVICRPNEQWQQGTSLLLGNPPGPLDCSSLGIPAPRAHQLLASLHSVSLPGLPTGHTALPGGHGSTKSHQPALFNSGLAPSDLLSVPNKV